MTQPTNSKTELRLQRTISRLQKQIVDLKASRDYFQKIANDKAKQ